MEGPEHWRSSKKRTVFIFLSNSCQSNLPPLEWNPGHRWGQHIFFPAWRGFLSPDRQDKKKTKAMKNYAKNETQPHAHTCKHGSRRTLCSIASRLLLSFKKLSFSRWACWVVCAACFFRVNSRSWRKNKTSLLRVTLTLAKTATKLNKFTCFQTILNRDST